MNAKLIFLPILSKITRMILLGLTGYLVKKGILDAQDSDSITTWVVAMLPAAIAGVPTIWWSLYAWLNKFEFVVKIETALHLPITGKPSVAAIEQAAINTAVSSGVISAAMKSSLLLMCLFGLAFGLSGCTAFRRDVSDVSFNASYQDATGDDYTGGVKVGIRAPVDHSK